MIPPNSKVHLVCSPFLRTLETAAKIASKLDVPIHIEEGFGEMLFDFDFDFDPMELLHIKTRGIQELERELGVQIIENLHMRRAKYPETREEGKERIRENWGDYRSKRDEEFVIVVSHLFVIGDLSEIWIGSDYEISFDGYCKMTVAEFNGEYKIIQCCDHSHAVQ